MSCPFCKRDPYHYVDVGVGYVPAAVDCCDLGIDLFSHEGSSKFVRKVLREMQSPSPRAKARAMKVLREFGYKPARPDRNPSAVVIVEVRRSKS